MNWIFLIAPALLVVGIVAVGSRLPAYRRNRYVVVFGLSLLAAVGVVLMVYPTYEIAQVGVSDDSLRTWAPVALLGVTFLYVVFTGYLVVETARLRLSQSRPYVNVMIRPHRDDDPNFLDMVIRNSGSTAARNIRLTASPDFMREEDRAQGEGRMLSEVGYFAHGISYLAPSEERVFFFTATHGHNDGARKLGEWFDVTVEHQDEHGRSQRNNIVRIDLREFRNVGILGRSSFDKKSEQALEKIARSARGIETSLGSRSATPKRRFRREPRSKRKG